MTIFRGVTVREQFHQLEFLRRVPFLRGVGFDELLQRHAAWFAELEKRFDAAGGIAPVSVIGRPESLST